MPQFVYTMHQVGKIVPPKREILKDISLSFFPGAKIGVLGLNGSGKSTLLRIMAGEDSEIQGEARAQPGIKVGYLPQEPHLDESKDVTEKHYTSYIISSAFIRKYSYWLIIINSSVISSFTFIVAL